MNEDIVLYSQCKLYTQAQKLSNFLWQCTAVQNSVNYFHEISTGKAYSPVCLHSTSFIWTLHCVKDMKDMRLMSVIIISFAGITYKQNNLGSGVIKLMPLDGKTMA